jgi:hypothetical protein
MHMCGRTLGVTDERAARQVLDIIDRLKPNSRERLRALVDWVEAYERAEPGTQSPHLNR